MLYSVLTHITGLLLLVLVSQTTKANYYPQVVYGDDSCREIADVFDLNILKMSSSSMAIIPKENVKAHLSEDWSNITGPSFGEAMKLCPEEKNYHQISAANCSAVLIDKNIVLTAGHCIENQADCENYAFVLGYELNRQRHEPRMIANRQIYLCEKLLKRKNSKNDIDFALVKLNRQVNGVEPAKIRKSGSIQIADELTTIGYPMGLPKKVSNGFVRKIQKKYFKTNLDVSSGSSGAGVFNVSTRNLEGILIEGEEDFDFDKVRKCNQVRRCYDDGCEGEAVLKITELLPYLSN